jgi:hypothetical protein
VVHQRRRRTRAQSRVLSRVLGLAWVWGANIRFRLVHSAFGSRGWGRRGCRRSRSDVWGVQTRTRRACTRVGGRRVHRAARSCMGRLASLLPAPGSWRLLTRRRRTHPALRLQPSPPAHRHQTDLSDLEPSRSTSSHLSPRPIDIASRAPHGAPQRGSPEHRSCQDPLNQAEKPKPSNGLEPLTPSLPWTTTRMTYPPPRDKPATSRHFGHDSCVARPKRLLWCPPRCPPRNGYRLRCPASEPLRGPLAREIHAAAGQVGRGLIPPRPTPGSARRRVCEPTAPVGLPSWWALARRFETRAARR